MRKLKVELGENKSYYIAIERGILNRVQEFLEPDKKYFVITNDTIKGFYKDFLAGFKNVIIIPDGEEFKNFETYKYILDKLLEAKIERNDCIITFGGGVIGDLAGFVASSVLRGIDFIQIPTTLLAQVDSSVGGKTGFNHPMGKNLIGAFYQPKLVLIDPNVLDTLDEKQIKTGLGEVLKYAFIEKSCSNKENFDLLDYLENFDTKDIKSHWEEIIYVCVSLKAAVVSNDETEKGLRAILNFGHTFGHGIEKVTNFKEFTHGEAVAMGVIMALRLAHKANLIDENYLNRAQDLINKFELIENNVKHDAQAIYEAMKSDKKVSNSKIKLVLPINTGEVEIFNKFEEEIVKSVIY